MEIAKYKIMGFNGYQKEEHCLITLNTLSAKSPVYSQLYQPNPTIYQVVNSIWINPE